MSEEPDELEFIREAIRDLHRSLDLREHSISAAWTALHRIEKILDMPWKDGAEQTARAEKIKAGK